MGTNQSKLKIERTGSTGKRRKKDDYKDSGDSKPVDIGPPKSDKASLSLQMPVEDSLSSDLCTPPKSRDDSGSDTSFTTPSPQTYFSRQDSSNAQVAASCVKSDLFSKYEPTPETKYFIYLARLLLDLCNDAMRDLLKSKIGENEVVLTERISRKKNKIRLPKAEREIILPVYPKLVRYNSLDCTLLYTIARNVCPNDIEPNESLHDKFGKTPDSNDTSLLAAIEHIRLARNEFFAHAKSSKISEETYKVIWRKIGSSLEVIQSNITIEAPHYPKEMSSLQTMPLDAKTEKLITELVEKEKQLSNAYESKLTEARKMEEETDAGIRDIEKIIQELNRKRKDYKGNTLGAGQKKRHQEDPIIAQTETYLEGYVHKNDYYVETTMYEFIEKKLREEKAVTILGPQGTGKTDIAIHLMFKYLQDGWTVRKINSYNEISAVNPHNKELVFVDDIFDCSDDSLKEWWRKLDWLSNMTNSVSYLKNKKKQTLSESDEDDENMLRLLMTSRTHLKQDAVNAMKTCPAILKQSIVDLSDKSLELTKNERKDILSKKNEFAQDFLNISPPKLGEDDFDKITTCNPPFGFPLCASLFACEPKYHLRGPDFFLIPYDYMKDRIENIIEDDPTDVSKSLFILLLAQETKNQPLNLNDKQSCQDALKELNVEFDIDYKGLKKEVRKHRETFLKQVGKHQYMYRFIHQSVFEAVETFFMLEFFERAVYLVPFDKILKKVQVEETKGLQENVLIDEKRYDSLSGRFLLEIDKGNLSGVCSHPALQNDEFCNFFYNDFLSKTDYHKYIEVDDSNGLNLLYWLSFYGCVSIMLALLEKIEDDSSLNDKNRYLHQSRCLLGACSNKKCNDDLDKIIGYNRSIVNFCICEIQVADNKTRSHETSLSRALVEQNDYAMAVLLKYESILPHSTWNGWPIVYQAQMFDYTQLCNREFLLSVASFENESKLSNENTDTLNVILAKESSDDTEQGETVQRIHDNIKKSSSLCNILLCLAKISNIEFTSALIDMFLSLPDAKNFTDVESNNPLNNTDERGYSVLHLLVKLRARQQTGIDVDQSRDENIELERINSSEDEERCVSTDIMIVHSASEPNLEQKQSSSSHLQAIQTLISKGANPNIKDNTGFTPLMIEIGKFSPDIEVVHCLLEGHSDVNMKDERGRTSLHLLTTQNYTDGTNIKGLIQLLIGYGCSVNIKDRLGNTALFYELQKAKPDCEIVQVFTEGKLDFSSYDNLGKTALHMSLSSDYLLDHSQFTAVVSLLFNHVNVNILQLDNSGKSPFSLALEKVDTHKEILIQMISHDCCRFPLHLCVEQNVHESKMLKAIKAITETQRFPIADRDLNGRTLIMTVVLHCPEMTQLLQYLLSQNIDINATDNDGNTALHHLMLSGKDFDVIESTLNLLIDRKPDVNIRNNAKITVLEHAMLAVMRTSELYETSVSMTNHLDLESFPSVAMTNKIDHTIEGINAEVKESSIPDIRIEVVEKLLKICSPLADKNDKKQRSYLHYCASSRLGDKTTRALCEILVNHGLDVDAKDITGMSSLEYAFKYSGRNFETLTFLIQKSRNLKSVDMNLMIDFLADSDSLYPDLLKFLQLNVFPQIKPNENIFHRLAVIGYDGKKRSEREEVFDLFHDMDTCAVVEINDDGKCPLHVVIESGASTTCLLNFIRICSKQNIDIADHDDNTPLHLLVKSHRKDYDVCLIVQKMIQLKSNVNAKNQNKRTPIMLAVLCNEDRKSTIRALISAGADLKCQDRDGYNVVHYCIECNKDDFSASEILNSIFESEQTLNINIKNNEKKSALNLAASHRHHSRVLCILKLLSSENCNIDTCDILGRSPIYNTSYFLDGLNHLVILERLLRVCIFIAYGCKPWSSADDNTNAVMIAEEKGYETLSNLMKAGKDDKMVEIIKEALVNVSRMDYERNDNEHKIPCNTKLSNNLISVILQGLEYLSHRTFSELLDDEERKKSEEDDDMCMSSPIEMEQ